jgi:hypothetical protein
MLSLNFICVFLAKNYLQYNVGKYVSNTAKQVKERAGNGKGTLKFTGRGCLKWNSTITINATVL